MWLCWGKGEEWVHVSDLTRFLDLCISIGTRIGIYRYISAQALILHLSRLQGSPSFLPSLHSDTWSDEQGWDKLLFTDWHQSWCWEAGERAVVMSLAQVAQCNAPCLSLECMLFLSQAEEHFLSWLLLGNSLWKSSTWPGLAIAFLYGPLGGPKASLTVSLGSRAGVCLAGHSSSHPFCARSISAVVCMGVHVPMCACMYIHTYIHTLLWVCITYVYYFWAYIFNKLP